VGPGCSHSHSVTSCLPSCSDRDRGLHSRRSLSHPRRASSRRSRLSVWRASDLPRPCPCAQATCFHAAQSPCSRGHHARAWRLNDTLVRACWVRELAAFNSCHGALSVINRITGMGCCCWHYPSLLTCLAPGLLLITIHRPLTTHFSGLRLSGG